MARLKKIVSVKEPEFSGIQEIEEQNATPDELEGLEEAKPKIYFLKQSVMHRGDVLKAGTSLEGNPDLDLLKQYC